jgi:hypothetical protein
MSELERPKTSWEYLGRRQSCLLDGHHLGSDKLLCLFYDDIEHSLDLGAAEIM